jgi:hypothetical protein
MAKKKEAAPDLTGATQTAAELLNAYVSEFMQKVGEGSTYGKKMTDFPTGRIILELNRENQVVVVEALLDRLLDWEKEGNEIASSLKEKQVRGDHPGWGRYWNRGHILRNALERMLRRKLPLGEARLIRLLRWPLNSTEHLSSYMHCLSGLANAAENFAEANEVSASLHTVLESLIRALPREGYDKDCRKIADRLQALLPGGRRVEIHPGEAWSDPAIAALGKMKGQEKQAWEALLLHCQTGGASPFTSRWEKEVEPLIEAIGFDSLKERLLSWFPLVDKPRTQPIEGRPGYDQLIKESHVELLRALVWCAGLKEDADLARALSRLALSAYRKIPGKGPRLVSLGNACVTALGMMLGLPPIGQLAILKVKVKFGTAQKEIDKAFNASASREKLPREDIEELAVPSYGLEEVGVLRESFGDYQAELTVDGSSAALHWLKQDKPIKSVPAAVKKEHAAEVKELQTGVKDINAMLPAQRERLDTLFLSRKSWPLAVWRERYLDHPLIGTLARRLIWSLTSKDRTIDGIWHGGDLVGVNGSPLSFNGDVNVSLWHPIGHALDEVLQWRDWLERREVIQPFKQAHREVYLLTDAEHRTRTYSNRFAAHVLRQHQFHALCAARGWKNRLRLLVDDSYPPAHRLLPTWGLRAEYWIEGAGGDYGRDTNEAGAFLYLTTDQVRFYALNAPQLYAHAGGGGYGRGWAQGAEEPLPLETIPPLVFSEILRDVDLFVGVASVGNDPNWSDGGPEGRYRDYWQSYSFGELSATAQTRRVPLERLLPRLKIADRCTLSDRFLIVGGSLRTYKIHLGSGNILMAPNDQYLCIVPRQTTAGSERVFLPFEGDGTLSVILSKAFLLADDACITDPSITSQLKK